MERPLRFIAIFIAIVVVVALLIGRQQLSVRLMGNGVFVKIPDNSSGFQLLSMGWVDDADGDQFPDLIVFERLSPSFMKKVLRRTGISKGMDRWVKLVSGRTGEVIQVIHTHGEDGDQFIEPFGLLPGSDRLAALRPLNNNKVAVFDGTLDVFQMRAGSQDPTRWLIHPETNEVINLWSDGSRLNIQSVIVEEDLWQLDERQPIWTAVWVYSPKQHAGNWLMLIMLEDWVDSNWTETVLLLDWHSKQVLKTIWHDRGNDLLEAMVCDHAVMATREGEDLAIIHLQEKYRSTMRPIPVDKSNGHGRMEAGHSLLISFPWARKRRIAYQNIATGVDRWSHDIGSAKEAGGMEGSSMSLLRDYNGDGFPEIGFQTKAQENGWLGVDFPTRRRLACVLDGATGELFTPPD